MKFFLAVALIASVASAAVVPIAPVVVDNHLAEVQQILDAINSPSTNPATAAALELMLLDLLGQSPISVGPALVDHEPISVGPAPIDFEPISVGPAPIDFEPISVGPALIDEIAASPVAIIPSPVAIIPGPVAEADTSSAPLVQIILNINKAGSIVGSPVVVGPAEIQPTPVIIVDSAPEVEPTPVQVVDVAPTPVQVQEQAPVPAEPVLIGTPILPSPAVNLPETLN